jgi:LCP family protein required for cell wall assembly
MNPLDGLKRSSDKNDKVYRSNGRVNFLVDQKTLPKKPINRLERPRGRNFNVLKIVLILILIFLITGAMYLSEKIFTPEGGTLTNLNKFNPFLQLAHLITSDDKKVDGEFQDRVNILALGIGGEGHDGPYLTDTIIVISIKPSTGEVGLLSIPRDMTIQLRDGNWYKINQVYSMGKVQKKDQGVEYITQAVEDTLDIDIHYSGVITFQGFEEFIDEIGGISLEVPVAFTDNQYPTKDYKTTTVSFSAGSQVMNGETALIYARSRHGSNYENSDFARSRRQQLILQAIKDKMFKFSTLLSPQKLSAIFDLLDKSIETNMSIWQAIKIANMVKDTGDSKIYRITLDDAPDSLLEPGFTEDGQWILQPKDGNFDTLARQFNNIFNTGTLVEEDAKIEILNGTATNGLAYWTAVHLEKLGYDISRYGNADTQDYQRTVIYDLANRDKKKTLNWLKEDLGAYVSKSIPQFLLNKYQNSNASSSTEFLPEAPDLVAILGLDYAFSFKLPKIQETATSTDEMATSTDEVIEE